MVKVHSTTDLLTFSPDRWSSIPSRSQQLMTRFSEQRRVYFVEDPQIEAFERPFLRVSQKGQNLQVATPCLPAGLTFEQQVEEARVLLADWIRQEDLTNFTTWYFTPSPLRYTRDLEPEVIVYHRLCDFEANLELQSELLDLAQIVFTELHLQDVMADEELLLREEQARESLRVPPLALLNARKRGTLVAGLS